MIFLSIMNYIFVVLCNPSWIFIYFFFYKGSTILHKVWGKWKSKVIKKTLHANIFHFYIFSSTLCLHQSIFYMLYIRELLLLLPTNIQTLQRGEVYINLAFFKKASEVLTSLYSHKYLIFTVVLKTYSQTNIFLLSSCIIKIFNIPL